jgi:hypothetical protein
LFPPPKRRGGPAGRGFWVFTLSGVPRGRIVCLARQPPDAPLGFALLGPANRRLGRDFAPPPLTRFSKQDDARPTRLRPRVSIGLGLIQPGAMQAWPRNRTAHLGFLHPHDPPHSDKPPPGL